MSTEAYITLGLAFSIFLASERLLQKFQCRQKSMETFWQLSLNQIWSSSHPLGSNVFLDRCGVVNRTSIGQINSWQWGNSSLQVELKAGGRHE